MHICIYRYSCKQLCENRLIYKFILVETLYFKKNCTFKWDYWDSLSTLLKDRLDIYTCTYIMKNTLHQHVPCWFKHWWNYHIWYIVGSQLTILRCETFRLFTWYSTLNALNWIVKVKVDKSWPPPPPSLSFNLI